MLKIFAVFIVVFVSIMFVLVFVSFVFCLCSGVCSGVFLLKAWQVNFPSWARVSSLVVKCCSSKLLLPAFYWHNTSLSNVCPNTLFFLSYFSLTLMTTATSAKVYLSQNPCLATFPTFFLALTVEILNIILMRFSLKHFYVGIICSHWCCVMTPMRCRCWQL